MPVLGADEEIGHAVAVPVDGGGARIVACELLLGDGAEVAEGGHAVLLADVFEQVHVDAVYEQVEAAVAGPVGDAELAAAAFAGGAGVEPQPCGVDAGGAVAAVECGVAFDVKDSLSRADRQLVAVAEALEQG